MKSHATHCFRVFLICAMAMLCGSVAAMAEPAADVTTYANDLVAKARTELSLITGGKKDYLKPEQWRPVAYAAKAPQRGVTLDGGPLLEAFERNIAYLNEWFAAKKQFKEESGNLGWEKHLPASSWGRMLGGAAQTLRWGEREDMRRIVDAVVTTVKSNQRPDGYCLPYDEALMKGSGNVWHDERRNYDRVCLTRGMVAAAMVGNPDALTIMRKFYDWLYASPYSAGLLAGPFDNGSSHNCNNGHEGSLLMYFSPAGKPEDLVAVERYFVQDFFLEASARKEALSLSHYPFHVAHSYVLLAYKAWLDHYRATGAAKYLEAAKGAWDIVHEHYLHVGGSLAICEHQRGTYPPDSYFLRVDREHHTGETCGSVFWMDINHRLLQFFPEETKYADEIERSIFNCVLACQDARGHIRYHSRMAGTKDRATSQNTCCEVMSSLFLGSLPQYLYSAADDGLYVNLFAPSTIQWKRGGQTATVKMATKFPFESQVSLQVAVEKPVKAVLHVRVPGWAAADMPITVNGKQAAVGKRGSYQAIDRTWADGDTIAFTLPMDFRVTEYTGADQIAGRRRCAVEYGPILLAAVGPLDANQAATIAHKPEDVKQWLKPKAGRPLCFAIEGDAAHEFMRYWLIDGQPFCVFPIMGPLTSNLSLSVDRLRCEYLENPPGIDARKPRLGWIVQSDERGQTQTAYQVLVASTPELLAEDKGDLWDGGKVISDQSIQVEYAGKPLASRQQSFWKVRVWLALSEVEGLARRSPDGADSAGEGGDRDGKPSAWSAPALWTMGLLEKADWKAKWIADPDSVTNVAAPGPHNGYHSEIAKSADAAKWVAVDLGQPQGFDAVRLFPARPYDWQPDTPGFLFPVRFKIEAAQKADSSDARLLLDRTEGDEPNPGTNAPVYHFPATTARYVRLAATQLRKRDGNNFAFALAEMQVLSGDRNLAAGAKVTAMDSIETGAWAKANLTDGVTITVKPGGASGALPATLVRKSFALPGTVRRATVYVSALGLYELHINGRRVGDQLLAPEWTSYGKRVQYQTFDVTGLLRSGENTLAAMLGEGWYAGRLMDVGRFAYGTHPRFLLQLEIELADGRKQQVVTDDCWRSTINGPIVASGIYDGETYDAGKEEPGWDAAGFDDSRWSAVKAFDLDSRQLVWQRNEPIRVMKELQPVKLTEPKPGVYVFDLDQNMVGWCRVKARGAAGQTVVIRHAEMLNDDGTLYAANLRGAPQVDRYTPRSDGEFLFEPHFTYHGFRYVELTGLAERPTREAVLGRVFHSSSPEVGRFECSDPSLNQLMRNIVWTQRGNLMSTPNDCPQRDERFGWMGDIQAFSQTAIFNMDLGAFVTKFAQDIRDDQADDGRFPDFAPHPGDPNKKFSGVPAWGDAGTIVPWRAYENYADSRLLAEHFEAARRWVDYIHTNNPDLIWAKGRNNDYNDWLNGDWIKQAGWPNKGGSVPKEVFATAFFAHSTEIVAKMAEVIGREEEARRYGELFRRIKDAFNQKFVKPDGRIEGDTQGGYALALNFNLLPDGLRPKAEHLLVENLRRYHNHLSTGIQTTHRAMLELTRNGDNDVAWQLLTNRTFPSWLYMIDNGATTIWERWDGYVKGRGFQNAGMNSFNHWAFGAVGEWVWRQLGGINPDEDHPGYKHFLIRPRPVGDLTWVKAHHDSMHGRIVSHWTRDGDKLTMDVTIPANTTATVYVPARDAASVTEGGKPAGKAEGVKFLRMENAAAVFRVGSGRYHFTVPQPTAKTEEHLP